MKPDNITIKAGILILSTIGLVTMTSATETNRSEITNEIASVIHTFNQSLSTKNLDGMLSTFADGAVQITLRPAHAEMATGDSVSSDLKTHWSTVGPVLFSTMKSYKRVATIVDVQLDGDVASVWTRINTTAVALGSDQSRQSEFTELYLIVNPGHGWKIGAVADNRQPDEMRVP